MLVVEVRQAILVLVVVMETVARSMAGVARATFTAARDVRRGLEVVLDLLLRLMSVHYVIIIPLFVL